MKVSLITVCFNSESTIRDTIVSVINQDYQNIEYIIIDGFSSDSTMNIVNEYKNSITKIISEPDGGIYSAINKGISLATGDVIGILNSDDTFTDNFVLSSVVELLNNSGADCLIGNICFVNDVGAIKRTYLSNNWSNYRFFFGMMPPHPSFYCKRSLFAEYGFYREDMLIASDFDLLLRYFAIHKLTYVHLNKILVSMKFGGVSSNGFKSIIRLNREIYLSLKSNNLFANYFVIYLKYIFKIFQFNLFKVGK
jgi:glycosyltransferase involved in cell wall biosynthesis